MKAAGPAGGVCGPLAIGDPGTGLGLLRLSVFIPHHLSLPT